MSNKIINAVWTESKSTGRARTLLLAIADLQGDIGAWPSISTLAKMVNTSERTIQRDIQELVDLGELRVGYRQAPNRGQYKANLYWVILPSLSEVTKSDSEVTKIISEVTNSRSEVTTHGVISLIEPLKNPDIPKSRKAQIKEDYEPDEKLRNEFATKWPRLNYTEQLKKFRNHHIAVGSTFVKPDKAFENWCDKATSWLPPETNNDDLKIDGAF